MKTPTKSLQKIAKSLLKSETLKKINSLDNEEDKILTLRHAIVSELKIRHHNLEMQIKELENKVNQT